LTAGKPETSVDAFLAERRREAGGESQLSICARCAY